MGLVDEMPEASDLGPSGGEGGLNMSATVVNSGDSSNLSSLAASANQKVNV